MIGVYAHAHVKPEHVSNFEELAEKLAEASIKEEGVVSYEVGPLINPESPEDPQYAFIERWDSIEALEAHLETDHYVQADAQCQEYLATPMQISIYEI
ncbi:putative quinol monooxygenase [Rothia aerolata]|uniref:Antibiotic biosynthesis monooxygenase n=1 Tax=Rothia aerolata TaxID=1812262 RepID=A0A917IUA3_9MICC|nr:putative quinol monooxygenase [Rothia aerolata]GGH64651.1 hypothetical protein GCM10007359_17120 [Rothia aerolata]